MKFSLKVNDEILTLALEGDLIGENSGIDLMEAINEQIETGVKNVSSTSANCAT